MKKFLLLIFLAALLLKSNAQTITTVAGGNGLGTAANQLSHPSFIWLDSLGNIYVADAGNNRIQKFPPGSDSSTNGVTVAGVNGYGIAADALWDPQGIVTGINDTLYVADYDNHRIESFPPNSTSGTNGTTIAGGNGQGSAPDQVGPGSIYRDNSGNMYACDIVYSRIQKFPPGSNSTTNGTTIAGGNGCGSASNQLCQPSGIFMDMNGNTYVSDWGNNRVLKFPSGSDTSTNGVIVAGGNGQGSAANQLNGPSGIFIDGTGNLYVADYENNRVQKFPPNSDSTTNGVTVAGGNGQGSAPDQLYWPEGVYVDATGNIYIADHLNNRIQKWTQLTSGVSNISSAETISLYPNPNSGSFVLQTSGSIGREYIVYDMIGRTIAQGTISTDKQNIDLKGIMVGSYTLQVPGSKAIRFVIEN